MGTLRLFLMSTALSVWCLTGAANADNLAHNVDFAVAGTSGTQTDFTGTNANSLANYAAASDWLVWAGRLGGRVTTRLEPSPDWPGNRMLHVWVASGPGIAGIDQVFLPVHTGPQRAYYCAVIKIVSGTVGAGANDQGNGTFTSGPLGPTNGWVRIGGSNSTSPVNQVFFYSGTPNAEFYVKHVEVSPTPIACDTNVAVPPGAGLQTLIKPDPLPWTLHPNQTSQPNSHGFFDNMTPANKAAQKGPATGTNQQLQQQQPAATPQ